MGRDERVGGAESCMGEGVARDFRVGNPRPAGGEWVALWGDLNRVGRRGGLGARVLDRAKEGAIKGYALH